MEGIPARRQQLHLANTEREQQPHGKLVLASEVRGLAHRPGQACQLFERQPSFARALLAASVEKLEVRGGVPLDHWLRTAIRNMKLR